MSQEKAIIESKDIQFTLFFPHNKDWTFEKAFGKEFTLKEGGEEIPKRVYSSCYEGKKYRVAVIINSNQEQKFRDFLDRFCKEQGFVLENRN